MIWWSRGLVDLALTGYLWATVQALLRAGRGRPRGTPRRLPPLAALDRFSFHALVAGFPFLTLGLVLGTIAAARAYGPGWLWQSTPVVALATWAIYAVTLSLRAGAGWGGR